MTDNRYKPCHLCKRHSHPDELVMWDLHKYSTSTLVYIRRICLFCIDELNEMKRSNLAIKAAAA